ncbi:hypothetical protein Emag_001446 [Eimeria magna]
MTRGRADYETPASQRLSERLLSPVPNELATLVQEDKLISQGVKKPRKGALDATSAPCPFAIEVEDSLPYFVFRQLERNGQAEKACGQPDCLEGAVGTMFAHQRWARRPAAAVSSSYATTLCDAAFTDSHDLRQIPEAIVPVLSHANSLVFHGTRLTDIHPSLIDSPDDSAEDTEGRQLAPKGKGEKKSKKRGREGKVRSSSKRRPEKEDSLSVSEDTGAAALGKIIEADLQSRVSPIETEVIGSFATSINDRKEVLEAMEAVTADGASCLEALANKLDVTWVGLFPHEMQHVREGLLIFAAAQKLMEDLKRSYGGTYTVKPGSTVKMLDQNGYTGEQVFTVQAVEGTMVTLNGVGRAVDRHDLIIAADPVEARFVDMALQGSWSDLEKEDTELFSRLLDFAEEHGFTDSLNVAKTTGNPSGLLKALFSNSAVTETLHILVSNHALPGCLSLTASNLMVQGSPLLLRLLEKFMTGSHIASPSDQAMTDNPVARMQVVSKARVIQKLPRTKMLETQCQAGVFSELGINAAAVGELGCFAQWKRTVGSPQGPALRMTAHFSLKELTDLDGKLASAWLAAKLLLDAARGSAGKLLAEGPPETTAQPSAPETLLVAETTEEQPVALGTAPTTDAASNESQASSFIENTIQEESSKATSRTSVSKPPAAFVIGGNVNVNALNMVATFSICKSLALQGLPNLAVLAQSAFTNIRGYVSAAGAGLQDTKQQRKMAKGSDVYSAIYQIFMCGFSGDLLPPVFAPFSSIALQVGASFLHPLLEHFQSSCSLELKLCFQQLPTKACRSLSEPRPTHFALCLCGSANFLRVELEESASLPWQKVVQAAGEGVFSLKNYDAATRHLRNKSMKFLDAFTPCVEQVNEPRDLLQLQDGIKKKGKLLRKLKNLVNRHKRRRSQANAAMCEVSGEQQQLVRMLVAWWTLGPTSFNKKGRAPVTVAETFRSARLLFASYIFFNGHNPVEIGMELIKAGCKSNKFFLPPGWAMGAKKGKPSSKPLSFKEISPRLLASFKYLQSTLGSADPSEWTMPLKVSQKLVDSCGQSETVPLAELLTTDQGSKVLMGYQCMILQEQALKLISKVFRKKSKAENQGLALVLLRFLDGLHVVKSLKNTTDILTAFGRFVNTSDEDGQQAIFKEWNEDFPEVVCAWKQNDRVKEAMLKKGTECRLSYEMLMRKFSSEHLVARDRGTAKHFCISEEFGVGTLLSAGYTPPPPPPGSFAAAATELHCPGTPFKALLVTVKSSLGTLGFSGHSTLHVCVSTASAATPLHVGDLAKASQPDATDFCTSSSAQCAAADFDEEDEISVF